MAPVKGYWEQPGQFNEALVQLRTVIRELPERVKALTTDEMMAREPGKWSKKEVLGHLIDSALNNLKRFSDAQTQPSPYRLQPYDQNRLVEINRYQDLSLDHLLVLWQALNQQIVYVVEIMAETERRKEVALPGAGERVTLSWIFEDYVGHLEHHLKQIF
ncbi:DinB family protein [Larkinella soli]|uniref:DinB family protein n=1 Tax=Larkinella soli TaxID=1770527 RepID=UPI000FFB47F8|nr:DinB family protein [Larkinella soli]